MMCVRAICLKKKEKGLFHNDLGGLSGANKEINNCILKYCNNHSVIFESFLLSWEKVSAIFLLSFSIY